MDLGWGWGAILGAGAGEDRPLGGYAGGSPGRVGAGEESWMPPESLAGWGMGQVREGTGARRSVCRKKGDLRFGPAEGDVGGQSWVRLPPQDQLEDAAAGLRGGIDRQRGPFPSLARLAPYSRGANVVSCGGALGEALKLSC